MPRAFRFGAPVLRPGDLTRPRLLRAVSQRWDHRLTLVIAGPGFGKTTLLAQAIAENRLAPRGDDVWLGLDADDADAETLGADLHRAVSGDPSGDEWTARSIADAVWARSPSSVALVLDDVHAVPTGSPGMNLLAELLDVLPSNGHLVLAGRVAPAIPFARLATYGALERVLEDDLRFDESELAGFAKMHHVDVGVVAASAGWPAMAELTAAAERELAGDYVWQEVLAPLGEHRRRVLGALIELGGGDDTLLSAALGGAVDLANDLAGVPLVAADGSGRYVPHPLWSDEDSVRLNATERLTVLVRAADHQYREERFADAFELYGAAGAWDRVPALLVDACRGDVHVTAAQLTAWLDRCPPELRDSPGGLLAAGVRARLIDPATSSEPLRAAARQFADEGDVDGELAALSHLGHAAWWAQDQSGLAELLPRVIDLADTGHPAAIGLAAIGRSLIADVSGDEEAALEHARAVPDEALPPGWRPVRAWIVARLQLGRGNAAESLEVASDAMAEADRVFTLTLRSLMLRARWCLGDIDGVIRDSMELVDETAAVGIAHNITGMGAQAAASFAMVGDVDRARQAFAVAESTADSARHAANVRLAIAAAIIALADGDESAAADLLAAAERRYPFDSDARRHAWSTALALLYVLVPHLRSRIDELPLPGLISRHRAFGRAVVDLRCDRLPPDLPPITADSIGEIRGALQVRHAAELAVGLAATGRRDGAELFAALGEPGRAHARVLAEAGGSQARAARALLGSVPAEPAEPIRISMLGPLDVARSHRSLDDPGLRRDRVRALLALLVVRRQVTRDEAAALLWPDFDADASSNNLRVNLSHLERVLEPERSKGEAVWSIRRDGAVLRLVTGQAVRVDIDEFDSAVDLAAAAERDGAPSLTLQHLLTAAELWRAEPFLDIPDAEWLDLPRERLRSRFVGAALRAGQLLGGLGEHDRAVELAERILQVDPWSEPAHGLVIDAALARGDRTGAQRALEQCQAMLAELDADPSDATRVLARRVRAG